MLLNAVMMVLHRAIGLPYAASLFGDVFALQEVRLAIDSQEVATEEFDKFGWSLISCKPQPTRPGTVKSVMDTKQGGVGIAFRSTLSPFYYW